MENLLLLGVPIIKHIRVKKVKTRIHIMREREREREGKFKINIWFVGLTSKAFTCI